MSLCVSDKISTVEFSCYKCSVLSISWLKPHKPSKLLFLITACPHELCFAHRLWEAHMGAHQIVPSCNIIAALLFRGVGGSVTEIRTNTWVLKRHVAANRRPGWLLPDQSGAAFSFRKIGLRYSVPPTVSRTGSSVAGWAAWGATREWLLRGRVKLRDNICLEQAVAPVSRGSKPTTPPSMFF